MVFKRTQQIMSKRKQGLTIFRDVIDALRIVGDERFNDEDCSILSARRPDYIR